MKKILVLVLMYIVSIGIADNQNIISLVMKNIEVPPQCEEGNTFSANKETKSISFSFLNPQFQLINPDKLATGTNLYVDLFLKTYLESKKSNFIVFIVTTNAGVSVFDKDMDTSSHSEFYPDSICNLGLTIRIKLRMT